MAPLFPSGFDGGPHEDLEDDGGCDPNYHAERLAGYEIVRLRAENPGPFTLSGTNTWIVGDHPAYVVDPGPALPEHLDRLLEVLDAKGGLGGVALTHDHAD